MYYDDSDFCPQCGEYIETDFDHYDLRGRPVYVASCGCRPLKPDLGEPSKKKEHKDEGFRNGIKFS